MSNDRAAPIGVFDSGVGGLSVLAEIRALLPNESLLYVADSGFAPYGDRSPAYIGQRSTAVTEFLIGAGAKAIVVACNTATAAIAPDLRQRFEVPVIAIEPAVKPAVRLSRAGVVGVLATRGTLGSDRFGRLVGTHAVGIEVVSEACPDLVALVERGITTGPDAALAVASHVHRLRDLGADTIVLGCTHFHFLRALIEQAAGDGIAVVDTGAAVAAELQRRLKARGLLASGPRAAVDRFWTTGDAAHADALVGALWTGPRELAPLPAAYCLPPSV